MRTVKSPPTSRTQESAPDPVSVTGTVEAYDTYEIVRVSCPECAQPIALFADEERLPEHALCPTRWDPFGLTVCPGTGRDAAEAPLADSERGAQEEDVAALLTLPKGLDWRMQPFSHAGGHLSRPQRVPAQALGH
ncbi:hypothetical protein LHJ74_00755 [Streptomyces sp. N2-109]|uniref:Uncharacterized protein n=1 Tax=Streptomyces gossypii TaxID=2883101 RepID=A0ABT2JKT2_9ACTN|nr:hypothetical protein [Streptomyces gossypii]MCT2588487.1 hypothetical protein [Streptomyces gossypii]